MSVLCGYASIDERGMASGGKAGDQTGGEVKTGNWYYFGQTVVIRFKSRSLAKKAADVCKKLANNKHVGYDQSQRTTLFDEMKRVGWKPDKIAKDVETDCSAMIAVICNAVGVNISKNCWTGNLKAALMETGKFETFTGATYCKQDKFLRYGDIILNEEEHVIMALEDGEGTKKVDKDKEEKPSHSARIRHYNVVDKPGVDGKSVGVVAGGQTVYCYGFFKADGLEWWKIHPTQEKYICKGYLCQVKKV